ncbi:uncharacterized protein LOC130893051 [Diorhabda carinulata]|uniref:uncharacterized protein LOC130893051 n=1 Tax=Diorhabda carinulata TaxID=1163345 RepID=UPI0025A1B246|nr:uncharacterized protein LOC130893051 [Diorhabda carinulata]
MTDWLHCNKCYIKVQPDIKMFLVECAHIFCEKCIKRVGDEKCLICQKSNSFILIDKDMNASVQPFFIPVDVQIKKILEVYNFQMMHKQRLNQAQTEKYQYAKGQLFSCYNKLKGIMSENKMMRNMLLNNNRSCHSNAGAFMTSTPSVTNDGMSTFTPIVPNTKQIPGYAQRLQTFDIRRNPDQQNINRNIRPNVNLISENAAAMNDDVISQDYGIDVSLQLQTPILDKNKKIHGYPRIYHGRGGSRGMPIPHNQPRRFFFGDPVSEHSSTTRICWRSRITSSTAVGHDFLAPVARSDNRAAIVASTAEKVLQDPARLSRNGELTDGPRTHHWCSFNGPKNIVNRHEIRLVTGYCRLRSPFHTKGITDDPLVHVLARPQCTRLERATTLDNHVQINVR